MINIGQYIEMAINWMMVHFSTFFDAVNAGIGSFIIGFQHILFGIPFYITILVLAALAWMKAGRGTAIFTALGLLLIYGMGFWEATMQTLALVFFIYLSGSDCWCTFRSVDGKQSACRENTSSCSRLDADDACFCLSDSCCFVFSDWEQCQECLPPLSLLCLLWSALPDWESGKFLKM